jgi:RNA-directed DNA polymerase
MARPRSLRYCSSSTGSTNISGARDLVAYRLDLRLDELAKRLGVQYTRYADDLIFSGPRKSIGKSVGRGGVQPRGLSRLVCSIAADEGFEVNFRKTRIMLPGTRQHACGLTLNEHVNISRREFDTLKATLHNCARRGPASQNTGNVPRFRDHLLGRVAYVESVNAARGKKLRAVFEQIDWER